MMMSSENPLTFEEWADMILHEKNIPVLKKIGLPENTFCGSNGAQH